MLAPDDDRRPARAKLALEVARVVERGALEQLLGRLTETVVVLRIAMKHGRSLARAVRHPGSPPACSLARDGTPTPPTWCCSVSRRRRGRTRPGERRSPRGPERRGCRSDRGGHERPTGRTGALPRGRMSRLPRPPPTSPASRRAATASPG